MSRSSDEIRALVLQRFTRVAQAPDQEETFPVGPRSARRLGYEAAEIDRLPPSVTESFCGVGNPLGLQAVRPGQTVLDLGSGAGLDSILAARRVGSGGHVCGVDMNAAMLAKASRNAKLLGLENVRFVSCDLGELPLADESVDVALSNGVFNLCPNKPRVLSEVCRVLRPGGRLQMADILLHDDVTPEEVAKRGSWSD